MDSLDLWEPLTDSDIQFIKAFVNARAKSAVSLGGRCSIDSEPCIAGICYGVKDNCTGQWLDRGETSLDNPRLDYSRYPQCSQLCSGGECTCWPSIRLPDGTIIPGGSACRNFRSGDCHPRTESDGTVIECRESCDNCCPVSPPPPPPPPCEPNWQCELPINGYEVDGCGHRRANPNCSCTPNWACEQPLNGWMSDDCGNRKQDSSCNPPPPPTCDLPTVGLAIDIII